MRSGGGAGAGAGGDRAGRGGSKGSLENRRCAGDRDRRHRAEPCVCRGMQGRGLRALEKACPLLVPLVEEGWTERILVTAESRSPRLTGGVASAEARARSRNESDTLVLGCTHYPLLRPLIERAVTPGVQVIDSAEATAEAAVRLFADANGPATAECAASPPARWKVRAAGIAFPGSAHGQGDSLIGLGRRNSSDFARAFTAGPCDATTTLSILAADASRKPRYEQGLAS